MIDALPDYNHVLPLSSLRLLVSPLQLMSAALWGVVQQRAVKHYGLLEDFITAVLDNIPDLLTHSERDQLVLGLRAKVVLEMCRSDDLCCRQNIEPHLTRIEDLIKEQNVEEASSSKMKASVDNFLIVVNALLEDPYKRDMFYQKTFPSVFGPSFDSALCALVRKFLINFEKLLPFPSLDQTSLWLGLSPPVLKECRDILNQSEPLSELIQRHKQDFDFSPGPFISDFIFSSLSGQQDGDEETESKTMQLSSSCTEEDEKLFLMEVMEDDAPSVEVTLDESDTDTQDCNSSVTDVNETHSGRRKTFRCFVCGQTFCSLLELKRHIIPRCSADAAEKNMIGWGKTEHSLTDFAISADTSEGHMFKSRIISCSVCGDAFTSSTDLTNHMKAHTEDGSHICGQCDEEFDNYANFMLHQENECTTSTKHSRDADYSQEMHTGQEVMKECVVVLQRISNDRASSPKICTISCMDCGQRVLKKDLKTHQRKCFQNNCIKERPTNFGDLIWIKPCEVNSVTNIYKSKTETDSEPKLHQSSIETQSTSSSKQGMMKCTLCDETFSEILLMKRHYHNLHKIKGPYQCPVCKRPFVRLRELVKHHSNKLLFQCNTCRWCFHKRSQLRSHKKQFNDTCATPYICEICGKSCITASVLKCHKYVHSRPEETTVCSYCGKKFSSKYCLRVHMNRHTGGFSCPVCSKVFFHKKYLKIHMDKHNGILQPYLCEICGKDWPTKAYLKVHMVEHSQERPFKCDQCGMNFKSKAPLKSHFRSKHTDVRPFKCSVCSKAFAFGHILKRHMMKHTGVRPFVCPRCGKAFRRRDELKTHKQTKCF